jgi:LmbE family N-acetylglucosaminyl deacetylase
MRTQGTLELGRVLMVVAIMSWFASASEAQVRAEALKVDLLGVFAHPDDEIGVASTFAYYALGQGKVVAAVYCTRGEGGGNMVGTQSGEALGILREAEVRACLQTLGVSYCYFLDRKDFAYTESLLATLQRWNREETLRGLVRYIRVLRPEVVLTMDPAPVAGQHGHHQAAGLLATEAMVAAADPKRFPDQLSSEGLTVWQCRKLYYTGGDETLSTVIPTTRALVDGRQPWQIAAEGIAHHRSQAFGGFTAGPGMRQAQLFRPILSVLPLAKEDDLFRGLPTTQYRLVSPEPDPKTRAGIKIEFQSRAAISNYNRWIREQQIEGRARRIPADLSLVAGEANELRFHLANPTTNSLQGTIRLAGESDWLLRSEQAGYRVPADRSQMFKARITPPAHALGTSVVQVVTTDVNGETQASLIANVVPLIKVRSLTEPPSMDGSGRGWESTPVHYIPFTQTWQGKVKDSADSSGEFRLAVVDRTLYVDIHVKDDSVVSNIAPNDIRGHWRSDSVEICVDPSGGAENTLNCFKLGIFPFDSTGQVNAARDADARPGPIAQTAPRTVIRSQRTADGYRVQVAIPFHEAGITLTRRIGFNLLIYDGDKANAAAGENINKSRLAWSPRPGVQGRPEDWGRLDLE